MVAKRLASIRSFRKLKRERAITSSPLCTTRIVALHFIAFSTAHQIDAVGSGGFTVAGDFFATDAYVAHDHLRQRLFNLAYPAAPAANGSPIYGSARSGNESTSGTP